MNNYERWTNTGPGSEQLRAAVQGRACPDNAHAAAAAAVRRLENDRVAGLASEVGRVGRRQNGAGAAGHHRDVALLRQLARVRLVAHRLHACEAAVIRSPHACEVEVRGRPHACKAAARWNSWSSNKQDAC